MASALTPEKEIVLAREQGFTAQLFATGADRTKVANSLKKYRTQQPKVLAKVATIRARALDAVKELGLGTPAKA